MNARTHDAFAFASLITVAALVQPRPMSVLTVFAAVVGNVIGSLIPDMDQASNRLWDLLPLGDHLAKVFRRLFYKHRTLSHSILGAIIIYYVLKFILPYILNPAHIDNEIVLFSIMVGYASHLVADSLTKDGLPLLFPINIDFGFPPLKFLRITTGSWVENYVVYPAVGIYLAWFIYEFQGPLAEIFKLIGT